VSLPDGVRVAWREIAGGVERRSVSRALVSELLPGARLSSRCARCGGDHGRLRVSGVEAAASVSYAGRWAMVATLEGEGRVGLDAVPADVSGLDRVMPGADAWAWARLEAVVKADGRGLEVDPARVRIDARDDGTWSGAIDDDPAFDGYDVEGPEGVVVAVAVLTRHP
jgi:4'-phosphopantetheinyl transferase